MGNKNLNYKYENTNFIHQKYIAELKQDDEPAPLHSSVPLKVSTNIDQNVSDIIYDYIIIGSSPYGLTCAYYLSKINKKVLLIDKNETIGGTFRINRQDGYYSEINDTYYSDSFINFDRLLLQFGTSFKKLFRQTKYTLLDLINCENLSVPKDKILTVLNTEIIHNIYIPKEPNDTKLFKIWEKNIECDIMLGVTYEIIDNTIKINNNIYQINNLIYDQENPKDTNDTNIFYHWDSKIDLTQNPLSRGTEERSGAGSLDLRSASGCRSTIIWDKSYNDLILSDYMYLSDPNSVTVFSRKNNLNIDIIDKCNPTKIIYSKCYSTDNIEILVTNAIKLLHTLEPEIKKTVVLEESYNVIDIVKFLLLIKFILLMFKL